MPLHTVVGTGLRTAQVCMGLDTAATADLGVVTAAVGMGVRMEAATAATVDMGRMGVMAATVTTAVMVIR